MRQLVDQGDLRVAGEDRVQVHFLELCPAVLHHLAGNDFETLKKRFGQRAFVGLHEADDDICPPFQAPLTLVEHVVGLAHPGHGTEVDAEMASRLDHRSGVVFSSQ